MERVTSADPPHVEPETPASLDETTPHWPRNVIRASTVLAWLAVASFVGGVVLFALPVQNRYRGRVLQDCGVPAAYLKDGRSSAVVSSANPPAYVKPSDPASVAAINDHQCSALVAERAVPAAAMLLATVVGGLIAFVLAWIGHRADYRARWLAAVE